MSANVVLIDQDIACFRDAKAASPFKVSLELYHSRAVAHVDPLT